MARRFPGSRTTMLHTGWPGLAYGAVKMAASVLFSVSFSLSLSPFVVLPRLVVFSLPLGSLAFRWHTRGRIGGVISADSGAP